MAPRTKTWSRRRSPPARGSNFPGGDGAGADGMSGTRAANVDPMVSMAMDGPEACPFPGVSRSHRGAFAPAPFRAADRNPSPDRASALGDDFASQRTDE